jgi:hypothetical protein
LELFNWINIFIFANHMNKEATIMESKKTKDVEPDTLKSANTAYPFEIELDKNKAEGKRKKRKPINDAPLP